MHNLYLGGDQIDAAAISRHGIALGIDTNIGILWLQTADDNFRPRQT